MTDANPFDVLTLGPCRYPSPLDGLRGDGHEFVPEGRRIRQQVEVGPGVPEDGPTLERAGPRKELFFDPKQLTAAIVTCGGLSPGLNNVIRSLFYTLQATYGVPRVLGIRNGFLGLIRESGLEPTVLSREVVEDAPRLGGTVLGTSRGPQDVGRMLDTLAEWGVGALFCVGGDGTQRSAWALHEAAQQRGLTLAVVGVPKTIDNDIRYVRQSFGYATALKKAAEVIEAAHVEARSVPRGIGLVKLMGRDSGFIAAGATVASGCVNFTLVPEVEFKLDGPGGLLEVLDQRLERRDHAVIVVAEGAGQHLCEGERKRDASGNLKPVDIGPFLKDRIESYFQQAGRPIHTKYFDPSYLIRGVPAGSLDSILCDQMARNAVHAALAGKTGMLVGLIHNDYVNVPISQAICRRQHLDLHGDLWRSVLRQTHQPVWGRSG